MFVRVPSKDDVEKHTNIYLGPNTNDMFPTPTNISYCVETKALNPVR